MAAFAAMQEAATALAQHFQKIARHALARAQFRRTQVKFVAMDIAKLRSI
jgi:hypothetical protein